MNKNKSKGTTQKTVTSVKLNEIKESFKGRKESFSHSHKSDALKKSQDIQMFTGPRPVGKPPKKD